MENLDVVGRIHSIETFGTVDGPGIRFIVFMQGCALRCLYCHNPDSWNYREGKEVTVAHILNEMKGLDNFYKTGGITVSGGEPTLQPEFIVALFKVVKERYGLHTCVDTSGFVNIEKCKELIELTDLFLLDIKHIDNNKCLELTKQSNEKTLKFAQYLSDINKKVWIRIVLVPRYTDDENDLIATGRFLGKLSNIEKIEILPYHRMGEHKWELLNEPYRLYEVESPTEDEVKRAYALIYKGMEEAQF